MGEHPDTSRDTSPRMCSGVTWPEGMDRGRGQGRGEGEWTEDVVRGRGQGVWSENVVRGLGQQKERSSCVSFSAHELSMSAALRSVKNCGLVI